MGKKIGCAIIGSGNIGTDLMIKILRYGENLDVKMMVGIDPNSDGLARAERMGVATTHEGVHGLVKNTEIFDSVEIVFDATSAKAHLANDKILAEYGKTVIDLTPAAIGPFVAPAVNIEEHLDKRNVNMITCGGQATIPMAYAVSRVTELPYAEMVSSISSKSAGPGTRQNIDEFTETTSHGLVAVGGAKRGKAIIVLNPAEPPLIMRNTVYAIADDCDHDKLLESIFSMEQSIQHYVPGYRLKAQPIIESLAHNPISIPSYGTFKGIKVTILLEVEGAAHYLPAYAGNLDIMTAAGKRIGELFAQRFLAGNRNQSNGGI